MNDLRYAGRQLMKRPGFTATAVVTLALGIGANATIFGIVDRLLLRAPPHVTDADRVTRVYLTTTSRFGTFTGSRTSFATYRDLRDGTPSLVHLAAYWNTRMAVGLGPEAQRVRGALVTHSFFPLLGVQPILGRFFAPDEDRVVDGSPVAVLGAGFWEQHFGGDTSALGRELRIGTRAYTVVGVAPPGFTGVDLTGIDVWLPMQVAADDLFAPGQIAGEYARGSYWLRIAGRFAPGADRARAETEATLAFRAGLGDDPDSTARVTLAPIQAARGPEISDNTKVATWLMVVAGIVLLIACGNVTHLLLTRAIHRRRELAVRLALGAARRRLVRQLLVESLLLAACGAVAALLVVAWAAPIVGAFLLPGTDSSVSVVDVRVLAFTALVALLTAVLCGIAPALHAGRSNLMPALARGGRPSSIGSTRIRGGLLVGQVALTLILLFGTGLFVRSLRNVRSMDLGLAPEHVVVATTDLGSAGYSRDEITDLYLRMLARVEALPRVARASVSRGSPFRSMHGMSVRVPGMDSLPRLEGGGPYATVATPGLFDVLGMRLLRGRGFDEGDRETAEPVVVVSHTMAELLWPDGDAVGQCVELGSDTTCRRVIGVVADPRRLRVQEAAAMQLFVPLAQWSPSSPPNALLVRTSGPPRSAIPAIRRAMYSVAPNLPYAHVQSLRDIIDPHFRPWRLGTTMFGAFGTLALVLAAIGLYGVLAYRVSERAHELGVRVALGATSGDVVRLVVGQGIRLAAFGVVIGLIGALGAGRVVRALLVDVSPADPGVLTLVVLLLFGVAAAASYLPARRAVRIDPIEALRHE